MRKGIGAALAILLIACESGFSQEDIDQAKKSIQTEFEKRPGVKVVEVALIKESSNKLTGFVKLSTTFLGTQHEVSKNCTATMGQNRQYIWSCE
jgi:hypothetical protein